MDEIVDNIAQCQDKDVKTRVKSYNNLTTILSKCQESWEEYLEKDQMKQTLKSLMKDMLNDNVETGYAAAGLFVFFVENKKIMEKLPSGEEAKLCKFIIQLLQKSEAKKILTRGLLALVRSKFSPSTYKNNIQEILEVARTISNSECNNLTKFETLQVIKSLLDKVPSLMKKHIEAWLGMVFESITHDNGKVRDICYVCLSTSKTLYQEEADILRGYLVPFIASVKTKHSKAMINLLEQDCNGIIRIWSLLVVLLGPALHAGTSLVNSLLEVVEKAFKSRSSEIRVKAFEAWVVLINNFALDKKLLDHPKRLKLLVAPFRSNNSSSEDIAEAKLLAWWHLVCSFDKSIPEHFEIVAVPFLKSVFQLSSPSNLDRSLAKTGISPGKKLPGLTLQSVEALVLLLGKPSGGYEFSIPHPDTSCIPNSVFGRHYQILIKCAVNSFSLLDARHPDQLLLGKLLLQYMFKHINDQICEKSEKKDAVDMVKEFVSLYSHIETSGDDSEVSGPFISCFMEEMVIGSASFPSSVMNSRAFNVPTGSKITDVMNGTLNNFVINKTLNSRFIDRCNRETHLAIWKQVVEKSDPPCNKLDFFQFIVDELTTSILAHDASRAQIILELWLQTSRQLLYYIQLEQDINQGDNSEHDWNCLYLFFLFPIKFHEELNLTSNHQKVLRMWEKLWKEFSTLCSTTLTAEPNSECDYVAKSILTFLKEKKQSEKENPEFIVFLADILTIILGCMRFSELGKKSIKTIQSPAKVRVKSHPLHNLLSCVDLFCNLMERSLSMVCYERSKVLKAVINCGDLILNNIPKKMTWPLILAFIPTFTKAFEVNPSAKFNSEVTNQLIGLWDTFAKLGQAFLCSKKEIEHLNALTPLFVATLGSSNSGISERAKELWVDTFHKTDHSPPHYLAQVLKKVLPSSKSEEKRTEFESPSSDKTKKKEESPSIRLAKFVKSSETPGKLILSPLQQKVTPSQKSGNISLADMKDEDFVVIKTPKARKRLLTAHQAEKMMERADDIPALYNDLSQSTSRLPPGFATQDSIDNSESVDLEGGKGNSEQLLSFQGCFTPENKKSGSNKPLDTDAIEDSNKKNRLPKVELFSEDAQFLEPMSETQEDGKENIKKRKRKCITPSKKSLDDVRQSLKGGKPSEDKKSKKQQLSERNENTKRRRAARHVTQNKVPEKCKSDSESETEIPDSQDVCITPLLKPNTSVQSLQKRKASPSDIDHRPVKKVKQNSPNLSDVPISSSSISDLDHASMDVVEEAMDKSPEKIVVKVTPVKALSSFRGGDSPQEVPSTNSSPLASPLVSPEKKLSPNHDAILNENSVSPLKAASWGSKSISNEDIKDFLETDPGSAPTIGETNKNKSSDEEKLSAIIDKSPDKKQDSTFSEDIVMTDPSEKSEKPSSPIHEKNSKTSSQPKTSRRKKAAKASVVSAELPNGSETETHSTSQTSTKTPSKEDKSSEADVEPVEKKVKRKRGRPSKKKIPESVPEEEEKKVEAQSNSVVSTETPVEVSSTKDLDEPGALITPPEVPDNTESKTEASSAKSDDNTSSPTKKETTDTENDCSPDEGKISPPHKSHLNKLVNSVGTPERKQMKKGSAYSSRGAFMLACAQKAMQRRSENETPLEDKSFRSPSVQSASPASRKRLSDRFIDKPWAKHVPSPQRSPSVSILKKKHLSKEEDAVGLNDSFGSDYGTKNRRVSFADPPVSESVEIPPSPRNQSVYRYAAQKLNMSGENRRTSENKENSLPIFPSLASSAVAIDTFISTISMDTVSTSLQSLVAKQSIRTVGGLCSLSSSDLGDVDKESIVSVLLDYESKLSKTETDDEKDVDMDVTLPETSKTLSSAIEKAESKEETPVSKLQALLQECPSLLSDLVKQCDYDLQMNTLKNLMTCLPHCDVIDVYCEYLRKQKP